MVLEPVMKLTMTLVQSVYNFKDSQHKIDSKQIKKIKAANSHLDSTVDMINPGSKITISTTQVKLFPVFVLLLFNENYVVTQFI